MVGKGGTEVALEREYLDLSLRKMSQLVEEWKETCAERFRFAVEFVDSENALYGVVGNL